MKNYSIFFLIQILLLSNNLISSENNTPSIKPRPRTTSSEPIEISKSSSSETNGSHIKTTTQQLLSVPGYDLNKTTKKNSIESKTVAKEEEEELMFEMDI